MHVRARRQRASDAPADLAAACAAGVGGPAPWFVAAFSPESVAAVGRRHAVVALPAAAQDRGPNGAHVSMLGGRTGDPAWRDVTARALLDLLLLARARVLVGTFGSTFSTLARDLAGAGAPLLNVKGWPLGAYCLAGDGGPGADSFVEADCTSVDDDGKPTSAEPRLRGDALAAACRRRAANRTACPAPRGAPFGLACWR